MDRKITDILMEAVSYGAEIVVVESGRKPSFMFGNRWESSPSDRDYDFIEVQEFLWQVMDLKLQNRFFTADNLDFTYNLDDRVKFDVAIAKRSDALRAEFRVKAMDEPAAMAAAQADSGMDEEFDSVDLDLAGGDDWDLSLDLDTGALADHASGALGSMDPDLPDLESASIYKEDIVDTPSGGNAAPAAVKGPSPAPHGLAQGQQRKSPGPAEPGRPALPKAPQQPVAAANKGRVKAMGLDLFKILQEAYDSGCSDVHIGAGTSPLFRKDGELRPTLYPAMGGVDTEAVLSQVLDSEKIARLEADKELDLGFDLPGRCRMRGNICFEMGRMAGVFRIIPPSIRTLEELDSPRIFKALMNKHKGLILVTGPTGSGKSTSLAAMIDYVNKNRKVHILTIEDPVEFIHRPIKARITHRELGRDTKSFAEGLKHALRQDPDVILVGEMRDLETIQLAIMASETGHLVLSTLHTSSAAKSIHRIIDVFPPHQQNQIRMTLSENLLAIVGQTLVPVRTGSGRVAGFEIMVNTNAVANLIREEKVFQIPTVIETQSHLGMISMDQSLFALADDGVIDPREALLRASEPRLMKDKLAKRGLIQAEPAATQQKTPGK